MGGPEGNIEQCPCEKKEAMETQTGEIVMGQLRQEGWHFYKKRDGKDFWQPPRRETRDVFYIGASRKTQLAHTSISDIWSPE